MEVYKKMIDSNKIFNKLQNILKVSKNKIKSSKKEQIRFNDEEYSKIWIMILEDILPLLLDINERTNKLYDVQKYGIIQFLLLRKGFKKIIDNYLFDKNLTYWNGNKKYIEKDTFNSLISELLREVEIRTNKRI